jgi:probable rRNA maturation factor
VKSASGGVKIEIINLQNIKKIQIKRIRQYVRKIFSFLNTPYKRISLVFCDNSLIESLNKRFFKKVYPTDVLSFPLKDDFDKDYLGEIVVSVEEAVGNANRYRKSWENELILYVIHGILHLLGDDDKNVKKRKVMRQREKKIMKHLFAQKKQCFFVQNKGRDDR